MLKPRVWALLVALSALVGCSEPSPDAPAEELYSYYCLRCHGADGRGTPEHLELNPKNDLSLSEMVEARNRPEIHERIEDGYGPMPALVGKVESRVLDKLTDYTLELLPAH